MPDSGKVQDFTNPVTYSVTAEDGTKVNYQITVSRTKFSVKDITEFSFADFSPAIVAKIDAATKTITATLPSTADLNKLKPTIKISDRATVNPATGTVIDFSKAVNFTVTAEDASTQVYAVTITKEAPPVVVTGLFPTSITYIDNPLQVSVLKTVNYTWANGVLTKLIEKKGTSTIEKVFTRDKDGLITKIDVNFDGSKTTETYTYSADKKTITRIDGKDVYTLTYNDRGLLTKRSFVDGFSKKETAINISWPPSADVFKVVDDGDLVNSSNEWDSSTDNPLWVISRQTQFLFVDDYNYNTTLLFLGKLMNVNWISKYSFSSNERPAFVTVKKDSQKRVNSIVVVQSSATAQNMSIIY